MTELEFKLFKKLLNDNKQLKEDLDYITDFLSLINEKIDKIIEK